MAVLPSMRIDPAANEAIIRMSRAGRVLGTTIMPYRIRWEGHGVYRRFYGAITRTEFREAFEEMCGDVRYDDIRYIISDYLEAKPAPDITERELRAQAKLERLRFYNRPDTVQAMIVTDPRIMAFARYYDSLNISPYCLGIFETIQDARHWIASNPRPGWNRPSPSATFVATAPHA